MIFLQNDSEKGWKIEVRKPDPNTKSKSLITLDPTDFQGKIGRYYVQIRLDISFVVVLEQKGCFFEADSTSLKIGIPYPLMQCQDPYFKLIWVLEGKRTIFYDW